MDGRAALAFQFAKEIATQLITLSTGFLALTITFTKDLLQVLPGPSRGWLMWAWLLHMAAIVFGVMSLMGLTGTLMPVVADGKTLEALTFGSNVRWPAIAQIVCFAFGTAAIVVYAVASLRKRS
jgi:hypothetical protein